MKNTLVVISSNWIKKNKENYYGYPQWKFLERFRSFFGNTCFIAPVKAVKGQNQSEELGIKLNSKVKIIELPYFEGTISQVKRFYLVFYLIPKYLKYIKNAQIVFVYNRDFFSTIALLVSKILNKKTVFFIGDIWHKNIKEKYKNPLFVLAGKMLSFIQRYIISLKKGNSLLLTTLNKEIESEVRKWNVEYQRYFASLISESNIFYKKLHPLSEKSVIKILYVGWLTEGKGVQDLIKASSKLQKEIPSKVELHIVGNGYYKEYLVNLAHNKRVEAVFYGFVGNRKRLKSIYQGSDIFVLASYTEGYPKVVFEAASQGCFVITSDIVELEDLCVKYKTKDTSALTSLLKKAILDFDFYKNQIERQYIYIKNYTLEKACENIYAILNKRWSLD